MFRSKSRLGTKSEHLSPSQSHELIMLRPLEYVHASFSLFSTEEKSTLRREDSDSSTSAKLRAGGAAAEAGTEQAPGPDHHAQGQWREE